ncbi:hypothetical protein CIPAW_01G000100 [Carya illinoinensis]|uniref:Uncharacterized protein n=1 Tax=Carya illinoinensis TaxID=32201 RepID=A0A8T1RJH7_CARIL|nr:hypothetical protein CIPAW_01G000100 [Carya illinoinensis]
MMRRWRRRVIGPLVRGRGRNRALDESLIKAMMRRWRRRVRGPFARPRGRNRALDESLIKTMMRRWRRRVRGPFARPRGRNRALDESLIKAMMRRWRRRGRRPLARPRWRKWYTFRLHPIVDTLGQISLLYFVVVQVEGNFSSLTNSSSFNMKNSQNKYKGHAQPSLTAYLHLFQFPRLHCLNSITSFHIHSPFK